jgi:hypothetical protein
MSAIELNPEQHQMVKIIHDHAVRFPLNETGDAQLLQACYDYMDAFKRVMDNTSPIQMEYICQQYDGFYRFAKLMEMLAQGIADGIIDVPKDH